ncbi:ATP-grasp domain-containing protein [Pseudoflavitalea sp. G-6-1-2]|uniref:ATP-grasp domain-containing protein n=1 Tax=Pseudoflavitalea sp. G-6-1-2 TaxID=2728841 RepID=UPI00146BD7E7|nr:ATP-grasp domain-containing protein [Pseudoflavitalea sp. G-6-1-2]NML21798.1 ATP-grasp domain-containing protein [Pseudoflavitalea sp. G-6-1-2]
MDTPVTLLIPKKTDIEHEQIFDAWVKNGGKIRRLDKFWIKEEDLSQQRIAIYGNQAFALVVAQLYNVELLSPDDSLIARLDEKYTKRHIQLEQLGDLKESDFPTFIKPVIPKMFLAGVFGTLEEFSKNTAGLQTTEEILISTIIDNIQAEARCYIKDGAVLDIALYEGSADVKTGEAFAADFIAHNGTLLPRVVVVDIAYSEQTGWFVLEFNACWGAGLNNCKAEKVIDCIKGATVSNS